MFEILLSAQALKTLKPATDMLDVYEGTVPPSLTFEMLENDIENLSEEENNED